MMMMMGHSAITRVEQETGGFSMANSGGPSTAHPRGGWGGGVTLTLMVH